MTERRGWRWFVDRLLSRTNVSSPPGHVVPDGPETPVALDKHETVTATEPATPVGAPEGGEPERESPLARAASMETPRHELRELVMDVDDEVARTALRTLRLRDEAAEARLADAAASELGAPVTPDSGARERRPSLADVNEQTVPDVVRRRVADSHTQSYADRTSEDGAVTTDPDGDSVFPEVHRPSTVPHAGPEDAASEEPDDPASGSGVSDGAAPEEELGDWLSAGTETDAPSHWDTPGTFTDAGHALLEDPWDLEEFDDDEADVSSSVVSDGSVDSADYAYEVAKQLLERAGRGPEGAELLMPALEASATGTRRARMVEQLLRGVSVEGLAVAFEVRDQWNEGRGPGRSSMLGWQVVVDVVEAYWGLPDPDEVAALLEHEYREFLSRMGGRRGTFTRHLRRVVREGLASSRPIDRASHRCPWRISA